MAAVSHMLAATTVSPADQRALDADLAVWGLAAGPESPPDSIDVWEEHREALLWWCSGGNYLKFSGGCCLGLDVLALEADARLSGRQVSPDDYRRMQLIARQVAEFLNQRAALQSNLSL